MNQRRVKANIIFISIFFLLVGAMAAGKAVSQAEAADKVKFAIDWIFYGKHAGFYPAIEKGFYKDANLEVTMFRGYGSGDTVKRVAAGTEEFGFADIGSMIVARGKGANVKMLGIIHDKNMAAVYTLKDSGIKTAKDFAGKTGGASVGNAVRVVFPAFARANGFDPASIKWIDMAPEAQLPSLLAKRIDFSPDFITIGPNYFAAAAKEGKEVVEIRFSDFGLDIYSNGILTTDKLIKENPDLVKRFVQATMKGWEWALDNREEALKMFSKVNPEVDPKLAKQHWAIAIDHLLTPTAYEKGIGYMDQKKTKLTLDTISEFYQLPKALTLEEIYTNEFLPKILPKRK